MKEFENNLINNGITIIAGVDEAGRGPVAGPVVAAAAILRNDLEYDYINDSKVLTKKQRKIAFNKIKQEALAYNYIIIDHEVIDKINILEATKLAMVKAINNLSIEPEHVLIDAVKLNIKNSTSIIKGDLKSVSIAAASIIAKEVRDELMANYHLKYPNYDFINNKGYLTKKHRELIQTFGPCEIHRKTFEPIRSYYK